MHKKTNIKKRELKLASKISEMVSPKNPATVPSSPQSIRADSVVPHQERPFKWMRTIFRKLADYYRKKLNEVRKKGNKSVELDVVRKIADSEFPSLLRCLTTDQ